jgi:hypothetical protein
MIEWWQSVATIHQQWAHHWPVEIFFLSLSEQMERALLMEKLGNDTWSSGSV